VYCQVNPLSFADHVEYHRRLLPYDLVIITSPSYFNLSLGHVLLKKTSSIFSTAFPLQSSEENAVHPTVPRISSYIEQCQPELDSKPLI
jgi:hypothetical protein